VDFSIVIPVYNGADTIASCLRAVTEQSGFLLDRDYEIIVVDDGSNDDTAVIVAEFPVRLIRNEEF